MFRGSAALASLCLVVLASFPARADASDDWLGRDKALHFSAAAAISGGAYGLSALALDGRAARSLVGATAGIVAGAGKELYDMTGRGNPSWKDFTWDVLGTAFGVGVALLVDVAVRGSRGDSARTGSVQGSLLAW